MNRVHQLGIHVRMVVVVGASMERQWWWRVPSFEQESGVRWCFSLRSMDSILHIRAKRWRRSWCALSLVRDQSQIRLYVHWIATHGGYELAAEQSLHPCMLPYGVAEVATLFLFIYVGCSSLRSSLCCLWLSPKVAAYCFFLKSSILISYKWHPKPIQHNPLGVDPQKDIALLT